MPEKIMLRAISDRQLRLPRSIAYASEPSWKRDGLRRWFYLVLTLLALTVASLRADGCAAGTRRQLHAAADISPVHVSENPANRVKYSTMTAIAR